MKLSLSAFKPATLARNIRGLFTQNARAAPSVIRNGAGASSATGGNNPPGNGAFIGNLTGARGAASALAHSHRPLPSRQAPPPPLPPRPAQLPRSAQLGSRFQRPTTPPPPPPPQAQATMGYNIPPPPDFAPPPPPVPPGGNRMPPAVAPRSQAVAAWLEQHGTGNTSGQGQAQPAPLPAAGSGSTPAAGTPGPAMPPGALTTAFQAWFAQGGKIIEPPTSGKQAQGDWGSRGKGPKTALLPAGYLGDHGKAGSLPPVPIRSQAVKDWMQQGEGGKKAQDQRPVPPPKNTSPQRPQVPPKRSLLGERVSPFKSSGGQQPAPAASTQAHADWHTQGARPKKTALLPSDHPGQQGKAGNQEASHEAAPLAAPIVTPVAAPTPAPTATAVALAPTPEPQPPEGPTQNGLYAADGWLLESRLSKVRAACAGADSEASDDVDLDDWDED